MPQEVIEVVEREVEVIEILERGLMGMTGPAGPAGVSPNISYEVITSSQAVSNRQFIAANTAGGSFTLTLPSNPAAGYAVDIFDYSDTFDTNPLTIARNNQPIEGMPEDLVANVEGAYFTLIFTGGTRGWQVVPRYGVSGLEDVLTTQGDLLYRGASAETRLGIGASGQFLKVNSTATAPEWGTIPDSIDDYTVVTTSQTIVNGARLAADTSGGAFTLTLPATPNNGDTFYILDFAKTFDTNNLTLARNGSQIEGQSQDMACNVEGSSFKMVFTGSANGGWQMIPFFGVAGVASVSGTAPIVSSGGTTPAISITAATTSAAGSLSAADKIKLNAITGTNTGDQTITLTGNVTGSGTGSFAATIANDAVDNAKLANMAQSTIKGRATASTGDPEDLSASQVRTILNVADGAEVNVNADWDAVSGDAQILNKPATFTPSSHTHGNITNDGKVGSTSGLPVVTTTAGAVTTLALGTANQVLRVNSGATGVEFGAGFDAASPPAIGSTTPAAISGTTGTFTTLTANTSLTLGTSGILTGGTNLIEQVNSTNGQTFNLYRTTSSANANYERGFIRWGGTSSNTLQIGTEKLGTGAARALEFQTDGVTRMTLATDGNASFTGTITASNYVAQSGGVFVWATRVRMYSDADGRLRISNNAQNGFDRLQFGGTTSSFPALKRDSTAIHIRLADDSAFAPLSCGALTLNGNLVLTDSTGSETATFDAQNKLTANRTYDLPDASGTIALVETLPAGGTKTYAVFTATDNQPPANDYATLDTRNSIAVLDFDAATDESAVFVGIIPEGASLGSGLKVRLHWMASTATADNCRWGVQFEKSGTDLDSDSFDTATEAHSAANGTSGIETVTEITATAIDSLAAGDRFRLKVFRNADDATNDTMTGDAELVAVEVRSAA